MERKKEEILSPENTENVEKGRCWYFSFDDAVSSNNYDPFNWCAPTNSLTHHCDPFVQHKNKIKKKRSKHKCVKCGQTGHTQSNGWDFRPQHYFERIVWCLHRQVKHHGKNGEGCGGTWAEFHPDFLSQLPTVVNERFPFLTAISGLGMHEAMMCHFLHLVTKGVMFGTYATSINEIKNVPHCQQHVSHLDNMSDYLSARAELGVDAKELLVPMPFPPCQLVGEHNGIELKPRLLKKLFIRVSSQIEIPRQCCSMECGELTALLQTLDTLENYLQNLFQLKCCEGIQADHTFKCAAMIMAAIRKGKVFHASYDAVGLNGYVNFNRLTHTKANDEINTIDRETQGSAPECRQGEAPAV